MVSVYLFKGEKDSQKKIDLLGIGEVLSYLLLRIPRIITASGCPRESGKERVRGGRPTLGTIDIGRTVRE